MTAGPSARNLSDRQIAAATLASLPHITPARLRRMLDRFGDPVPTLEAIARGEGRGLVRGDPDAARAISDAWRGKADPLPVQRQLQRRNAQVWIAGDDDYPIRDEVPGRPAVLFGEGERIDAFATARVAVVGTRSASPHGLADAREIGADLAAAGVTVVSGLALGIDGAAHVGALAARGQVAGVVATGLDVTYPRRHQALYANVREHGVIVSEHAYGVQPHPAQFPVRNRIIAALCDACVVVEAKARGGAAITADYANDYGRTVFAVPGSRRNEAAAGCNALIKDGAVLLLDPGDVMLALQCGAASTTWQPPMPVPPNPDEARVAAALAGEAASVDQLAGRTGLPVDRLAGALRRLEATGRIERRRGRWWPR